MSRGACTTLPPAPSVLVLGCRCGAAEWFACAPGDAPVVAADLGPNVVVMGPMPGQAPECWCLGCWTARFSKTKRAKRSHMRNGHGAAESAHVLGGG
jgi:hypothetical protein